jgi:hypothetical protein
VTDTTPPSAQPGWYTNPNGFGQRYWDGSNWTDHVRTDPAPPPQQYVGQWSDYAYAAQTHPPSPYGTHAPTPSPYQEAERSNVLSVLAMVFGGVSTLFCPILFGPTAIILAAVAFTKKEPLAPVGMAIAVVCMFVGFFLGYIVATL